MLYPEAVPRRCHPRKPTKQNQIDECGTFRTPLYLFRSSNRAPLVTSCTEMTRSLRRNMSRSGCLPSTSACSSCTSASSRLPEKGRWIQVAALLGSCSSRGNGGTLRARQQKRGHGALQAGAWEVGHEEEHQQAGLVQAERAGHARYQAGQQVGRECVAAGRASAGRVCKAPGAHMCPKLRLWGDLEA